MAFVLFIVLFVTAGCQSLPSLNKNPSAQELFEYANQLKQRSAYVEALKYFKQFRGRYLYSPLVKKADLAIADIYFLQKKWNQAVQAYEFFSERHPRHIQSDRVYFHLALAYFHQLPSTPDRDLRMAGQALSSFKKHLRLFPKSKYKKSVLEYRNKILLLLAQREWMIARFHIRQGRKHSALPYVRKLLKKHTSLLTAGKIKNLPSVEELKLFLKEQEFRNKGS